MRRNRDLAALRELCWASTIFAQKYMGYHQRENLLQRCQTSEKREKVREQYEDLCGINMKWLLR